MIDSELSTCIVGLFFACPEKKAEKDCPFRLLRTKSVSELLEYTRELSLGDAARLVQHHRNCVTRK